MKSLLFRQISRNKLASLFFCMSILLIFTTLPLAATSLQSVHEQVDSDATYYGRGTYDLLIRPPEAKHPLEDELGMVPENYIGFGNGGISVEQWEEIKERSDIEIAAPVASLGYFSGVGTNLAFDPPQEDFNRYLLQYSTFDGLHEYPIDELFACFQLKYEGVSHQYDVLINHNDLMNNCTSGAPMFMLPTTYHLLVAIDPEEEEKLTSVSFDSIHPDQPRTGEGASLAKQYPNAEPVPIIEVIDNHSSIMAELHIDKLKLSNTDMNNYRVQLGLTSINDPDPTLPRYFLDKFYSPEYRQLIGELKELKEETRQTYSFDMSPYTQAFYQNPDGLYLSEEGGLDTITSELSLFGPEFGFYSIDHNFSYTSVFYHADQLPYTVEEGSLKLNIIGEELGVPIYREVKENGIKLSEIRKDEDLIEEVTFMLDPIDQIEIGERDEQLASSPLGIYQFAPVTYHDESTGKSIDLQPTFTPGSFVTPAAEGLTNIASGELIKGEFPIDAIRVKVAGITSYTKEAAQKIEDVSADIREMGFDVTIVAGSSPQKMAVEVEGIGLVEESWTTLGAVGTIISEWNVTNLVLALLFIVITLIYLINRMLFWQINNQDDIILLHQLGWKHKDLISLSRNEMLLLVSGASILALPFLIGFTYWGKLSNMIFIWFLLAVAVTISIIFILIHTKLPKMLQASHQVNEGKLGRKARQGRSLVGKNFAYFYHYIRSPFIQLLIASALASFVYLSLTETAQQTGMTLLGEYINLQINQWHTILMVSAYLLAFVTLAESLMSLMKIREKEITNFLMIGWRKKHIFWLYMREVMIWSSIALILGSVSSVLLFNLFYPISSNAFLIGTISFVTFFIFVLIIASFVFYRYLTKESDPSVMMREQVDQ